MDDKNEDEALKRVRAQMEEVYRITMERMAQRPDDEQHKGIPSWMLEQAAWIDQDLAEGKYDDILSGKRPEGMTKAEFLSAMQRTKAQWS